MYTVRHVSVVHHPYAFVIVRGIATKQRRYSNEKPIALACALEAGAYLARVSKDFDVGVTVDSELACCGPNPFSTTPGEIQLTRTIEECFKDRHNNSAAQQWKLMWCVGQLYLRSSTKAELARYRRQNPTKPQAKPAFELKISYWVLVDTLMTLTNPRSPRIIHHIVRNVKECARTTNIKDTLALVMYAVLLLYKGAHQQITKPLLFWQYTTLQIKTFCHMERKDTTTLISYAPSLPASAFTKQCEVWLSRKRTRTNPSRAKRRSVLLGV